MYISKNKTIIMYNFMKLYKIVFLWGVWLFTIYKVIDGKNIIYITAESGNWKWNTILTYTPSNTVNIAICWELPYRLMILLKFRRNSCKVWTRYWPYKRIILFYPMILPKKKEINVLRLTRLLSISTQKKTILSSPLTMAVVKLIPK